MSRTLFWYIFRDLLRIFLMTSLALAGIMSFGGLVRPLTDQGLDGAQVGRVLLYLLPAMLTYSLPIAAIFATTMVYGRLSADNELIACRGAGIDHFSIAMPALVLGLVVAIVGLLCLCFVVPVFTLRVERVAYTNLARWVANRIERTHQIKFADANMTIFALRAEVPELANPDEQVVILYGPMITTYLSVKAKPGERRPMVPERFYMARQATVYITQYPQTNEIYIEAALEDGSGFPRELAGATHGGIEVTQFGPYPVPSPIKENTKFMNILQLKKMFLVPTLNKKLNTQRMKLVEYEQVIAYLNSVGEQLRRSGEVILSSVQNPNETYTVQTPFAELVSREGEEVVVRAPGAERLIRFVENKSGGQIIHETRELRLRVQADNPADKMVVTVRLTDPAVRVGEHASVQPPFQRPVVVNMPAAIAEVRQRSADYYATAAHLPGGVQEGLRRDLSVLRNNIQSEMHARAAFAISCLILVVIGCALGMMFKSGNFLSAFAVSAVPAIAIITLIIAGQQVAGNPAVKEALKMGLTLIWSGNAVVAVLAVALMWRMQRT